MRAKIYRIGLYIISILLITLSVSSCRTTTPILFDRARYPVDEFYVGTGITKNADKGQALETAKMKAISDLASQIQTTIFSTRTASSSDDGTTQFSVFEELIEETLHQEFENVIYIEETYTRKKEQTTYAILRRSDWEIQKARKILREKEKVQSVLSSRYPDMSPVQEIKVLNKAIASLQSTFWGSLIEGIFDEKMGYLLPLIQARRDTLYTRVFSSKQYYIGEGSASSRAQAEESALQDFKNMQIEKMYKEYENLRVRLSSPMTSPELKEKIENSVEFSTTQNASLLEFLEGPESTQTLSFIYLIVQKVVWEDLIAKEVDTLYQQAKTLENAYQANNSVTGKLQILEKMQQLLESSPFGLEVENLIFPNEQSFEKIIPYRKDRLIASVNLHLLMPKSVKEDESCTLKIVVTNADSLHTDIPVKIIITDNNNKQRYLELVTLSSGIPFYHTIIIPRGEKAKYFSVNCFWTQYPQQKDEQRIDITRISLLDFLKNMFIRQK
ncbi:hypothetical protein [Sphaerochaeta globosa]|uniref:Lipoprotein n=1 Tax=Sphaerochaeta globosa (strain ATCC BAA-1886 / DSM 22777 / Buddy) TaxID=158189 RepID=F0RRG5_SPHGB|nr:hypothetical protein [Sphaerochaeta globosa]ADY14217.1 hypothetical protein SpiBuddy_2403 [Sphaerochaeta globosa str. Buddy]